MKIICSVLLSVLIFSTSLFAQEAERDPVKESYAQSRSFEQAKQYREAVEALSGVLRDYPDGYTVHLRCGWLYYLNGDYGQALEHYNKAIQVQPKSVEAMLGKCSVLTAQQAYNEATGLIHQIRILHRTNYFANLQLCQIYRLQKKFALAKQVAEEMLQYYPSDVNFLAELGWIKFGLRDKNSAYLIFKDVQILDPSNKSAEAYFNG